LHMTSKNILHIGDINGLIAIFCGRRLHASQILSHPKVTKVRKGHQGNMRIGGLTFFRNPRDLLRPL
jgi:hypothetical protein